MTEEIQEFDARAPLIALGTGVISWICLVASAYSRDDVLNSRNGVLVLGLLLAAVAAVMSLKLAIERRQFFWLPVVIMSVLSFALSQPCYPAIRSSARGVDRQAVLRTSDGCLINLGNAK